MEIAGAPPGEFISSIGQDVKSLLRCEYLYIRDVAGSGVAAIPKILGIAPIIKDSHHNFIFHTQLLTEFQTKPDGRVQPDNDPI